MGPAPTQSLHLGAAGSCHGAVCTCCYREDSRRTRLHRVQPMVWLRHIQCATEDTLIPALVLRALVLFSPIDMYLLSGGLSKQILAHAAHSSSQICYRPLFNSNQGSVWHCMLSYPRIGSKGGEACVQYLAAVERPVAQQSPQRHVGGGARPRQHRPCHLRSPPPLPANHRHCRLLTCPKPHPMRIHRCRRSRHAPLRMVLFLSFFELFFTFCMAPACGDARCFNIMHSTSLLSELAQPLARVAPLQPTAVVEQRSDLCWSPRVGGKTQAHTNRQPQRPHNLSLCAMLWQCAHPNL